MILKIWGFYTMAISMFICLNSLTKHIVQHTPAFKKGAEKSANTNYLCISQILDDEAKGYR